MSNVLFKRSTDVNNIPIIDGQVIFDELDNKIYMDNGNQRLQYGGDVSLISNIDYATANNAFSALATKNIFLRQNSVVDSKDSILAATESGLPVGCLGIQSIIGNSNYSAIGNTVSSALLTLNNSISNVNTKFTNQLKANSHDIYMDYKNGKYGYNTSSSRGADTFHPFSDSTMLLSYMPTRMDYAGSNGSTSEWGGASESLSIIAPANGILTLNPLAITTSGDVPNFYTVFTITTSAGTIQIVSNAHNVQQSIAFTENTAINFSWSMTGLGNWGRANIVATWSYTAT